MPLDDRNFSIDIAFPDLKIGIEINGNQHYNPDGSLKAYYAERHNLIVEAGWKLMELHYSVAYGDLSFIVKSIRSGTSVQPDYSKYFSARNQKQFGEPKKPLKRGVKATLKAEEKWKPYTVSLINSGIDFQKYGWVNGAAKHLGISPQKVKNWMIRYLPEFYAGCKKRKN